MQRQNQPKEIGLMDMFIGETPMGTAFTIVIIVILIAFAFFLWSQELSSDELDEFEDIMQNFHNDPCAEDFNVIYSQRLKLVKHSGKRIKFWIYGVYITKPEYFSTQHKTELTGWIREIERGLRRVRTHPTIDLIDCLASLYFATGNQGYLELIRRFAVESTDVQLRSASRKIYKQVSGRDYKIPIFGTDVDGIENTVENTEETTVEPKENTEQNIEETVGEDPLENDESKQ